MTRFRLAVALMCTLVASSAQAAALKKGQKAPKPAEVPPVAAALAQDAVFAKLKGGWLEVVKQADGTWAVNGICMVGERGIHFDDEVTANWQGAGDGVNAPHKLYYDNGTMGEGAGIISAKAVGAGFELALTGKGSLKLEPVDAKNGIWKATGKLDTQVAAINKPWTVVAPDRAAGLKHLEPNCGRSE